MLGTIKEIVKQTIEVEKLTDFTVGKVSSVSPLKIQAASKLILGSNQLVIPDRFTNHFEYMVMVDDTFDDVNDKNKYKERKKYIVYDSLKVGDSVILARAAGGQKYFVIDRVGVL